MKKISFFLTVITIALSSKTLAQEVTQVIAGPGTVQTTVASPAGTTTVTTRAGHSVLATASDGSKIELDSDSSVYKVFPDGARVSAPDGVIDLNDGTPITVKDGKRIP